MNLNNEKVNLGIAIPTYNRAETLDFFFKVHIDRFKKYNTHIFLVNNSSTDNTLDVLSYWKEQYSNIFWITNDETVHADQNVQHALEFASAKYVWLLGDSYEIPESSLAVVSDLVRYDNSDILLTNHADKHQNVGLKVYNSVTSFTNEICYLSSCISCLIFKKDKLDSEVLAKYRGSDFGHYGYVLDFIKNNSFKLSFLSNINVVTLKTPARKKPWSTSFFSILFEKLPNLLNSLNEQYNEKEKLAIIRLTLAKTGLLNFRNIMYVRASRNLNDEVLSAHKEDILKYASKKTYFLCTVMNRLPVHFCRVLLTVIEFYRRYRFKALKFLKLVE